MYNIQRMSDKKTKYLPQTELTLTKGCKRKVKIEELVNKVVDEFKAIQFKLFDQDFLKSICVYIQNSFKKGAGVDKFAILKTIYLKLFPHTQEHEFTMLKDMVDSLVFNKQIKKDSLLYRSLSIGKDAVVKYVL